MNAHAIARRVFSPGKFLRQPRQPFPMTAYRLGFSQVMTNVGSLLDRARNRRPKALHDLADRKRVLVQ
jgi:hypothetical protein